MGFLKGNTPQEARVLLDALLEGGWQVVARRVDGSSNQYLRLVGPGGFCFMIAADRGQWFVGFGPDRDRDWLGYGAGVWHRVLATGGPPPGADIVAQGQFFLANLEEIRSFAASPEYESRLAEASLELGS